MSTDKEKSKTGGEAGNYSGRAEKPRPAVNGLQPPPGEKINHIGNHEQHVPLGRLKQKRKGMSMAFFEKSSIVTPTPAGTGVGRTSCYHLSSAGKRISKACSTQRGGTALIRRCMNVFITVCDLPARLAVPRGARAV